MTSTINTAFCRKLLSLVIADIAKYTTAAERKEAWVYKFGDGSWEFHCPGRGPVVGTPTPFKPKNFYWYGDADNAYDARAKGWQAWLEHYHPEKQA